MVIRNEITERERDFIEQSISYCKTKYPYAFNTVLSVSVKLNLNSVELLIVSQSINDDVYMWNVYSQLLIFPVLNEPLLPCRVVLRGHIYV